MFFLNLLIVFLTGVLKTQSGSASDALLVQVAQGAKIWRSTQDATVVRMTLTEETMRVVEVVPTANEDEPYVRVTRIDGDGKPEGVVSIDRLVGPELPTLRTRIKEMARRVQQKRQAEARARAAGATKARLAKLTARYGSEIGSKILEEKVWIGMTADMLLESWGKPTSINSTITSQGTREQWVYGLGQYVYLEGRKVTAIQQSK